MPTIFLQGSNPNINYGKEPIPLEPINRPPPPPPRVLPPAPPVVRQQGQFTQREQAYINAQEPRVNGLTEREQLFLKAQQEGSKRRPFTPREQSYVDAQKLERFTPREQSFIKAQKEEERRAQQRKPYTPPPRRDSRQPGSTPGQGSYAPPPRISIRTTVVSSRTINGTSIGLEAVTRNVAGDFARAGIPYGQVRRGAKLITARDDATNKRLVLSWGWSFAGRAGVEAIDTVYINGVDASTISGVTLTHYTGQPSAGNFEDVDATMLAANPAYTDTGVFTHAITGRKLAYAYTIAAIAYDAKITGWPEAEAILRGMRVYDSREVGHDAADPTTWEYSTTPALALADYLASEEYGVNYPATEASVEALADINDVQLSGAPRHAINLLMERNASSADWVDTLRTYASCFIAPDGAECVLIPNRATTTERTITQDEIGRQLRLAPNQIQSAPSTVRVWYTDQTVEPWRSRYAQETRAGATDGSVQEIYLDGVNCFELAYRAAKERLNHMLLERHNVTWSTDDQGLKDQIGQVYEITHQTGNLSSYPVRVLSAQMRDLGSWSFSGVTYDGGAWTDVVLSDNPSIWAGIADPAAEEAPVPVTMAEELYSDEAGHTYSRLRATWAPVTWPHARSYDASITGAGVAVVASIAHDPVVAELNVVSGPVEQGQEYTAAVATVGPVGRSVPETTNVIAVGKVTSPSPPTAALAQQVGEFIYVSWTAAQEDDTEGYAVRRGTTSQTVGDWASLTVLAAKADVEYILDSGVPLGTHRYFIRTIDSRFAKDNTPAAAYSITAAEVDVEVVEGGTVARFTSEIATVSTSNEMSARSRSGATWYQTDTGQAWGDRWTITSSWASQSPANPWAVPTGTKSTPYVQTAIADFGEDIAGVWTRQISSQFIGTGGTSDITLMLADAASYPTFTDYAAGSAKATARYARVKVTDTGPTTAALAVRDDIGVSVASEGAAEGNLITAGDFISWQEGTTITPSASVKYAADLFYVDRDSDDAGWTISKQAGRTSGRSQDALRIQRTASSTVDSAYRVSYALESEEIALLWGSKLTIDLWVQTGSDFSTAGTTVPRIVLRTNTNTEGNYDDITNGSEVDSILLFDGTDLPLLDDGAQAWVRCTGSFATTVGNTVTSLCVFIENAPATSDTAGANDWMDIAEIQLLRGKYSSANILDFTTANVATTRARILRYLRYSETTGQATEFSHTMRTTPSESGSGPYKYDARL